MRRYWLSAPLGEIIAACFEWGAIALLKTL